MSNDSAKTEYTTFATGAKRSERMPRFDLIPHCALRRLAARYEMGRERYGVANWKKGLPQSDLHNHVIDHLNAYNEKYKAFLRAGESSDERGFELERILEDDDLAGALWGICAMMFFFEEGYRDNADVSEAQEFRAAHINRREQPQHLQREQSILVETKRLGTDAVPHRR